MAKWEVKQAFHPTAFEKGIYAVGFHQKGKPYLDRYGKFTRVKAGSRAEAIKKAKKVLNI